MNDPLEPPHIAILRNLLKEAIQGKIHKWVFTGFQDVGDGNTQLLNVDSNNISLVEGMALSQFHNVMAIKTTMAQIIPPRPNPSTPKLVIED